MTDELSWEREGHFVVDLADRDGDDLVVLSAFILIFLLLIFVLLEDIPDEGER